MKDPLLPRARLPVTDGLLAAPIALWRSILTRTLAALLLWAPASAARAATVAP